MRIFFPLAVLMLCTALVPAAAKSAPAPVPSETSAATIGDYLSARFAAGNHDLADAAKFYRASLLTDPDNPQLLPFAFFFNASAGNMEDAAKYAAGVVVTTPDDRAARLMLAVDALKHGKYKAARDEIALSAKGPFASFTVALVDGWAAAGMGDRDAAAAQFKRLHAQHSADSLAYSNEAMMAEMLGDKDAADAAYKASLDASGPTPRVVDAYGRFLERNGRAAEAQDLYVKAGSEAGFDAITVPGLARIAKGKIPEPLVQNAQQGAAEALFGIAAALNDESSRDVSIFYLRMVLYLQPKLDLATILLANRFEAMDKYEDAIAAYRTIAPDAPFHRLASVAVAVDLSRLDKGSEAIPMLQALASEYPNDIDTLTALGDTLRAAEKYTESAAVYDRAIAAAAPLSKRNWSLLFARAMSEQLSGDWPKAEADLKQALVLSPNEPAVLNYLGYTWVDQKHNISEAVKMLEKARTLSPQDGYIIDSVGWAYYRLGRFEDAASTLESAIQLKPADPTINDHLGDAYWKVGRKRDAEFQWNHALAFDPEPAEKAKIEKKLKTAAP